MAILETKNLSFTYPEEKEPALIDLSISVNQGEFIALIGPSGSGKSTLLHLLKREIAPHGKIEGEMFYNGQAIQTIDKKTLAKEICIVFQDPENQIVMNRVLEELVFGLENLGINTDEMRKKVAEMAHFFGIHHLLQKNIHKLSGGQKQMINLASVLLLEPNILLLDEPTAQLDPIAAKNFLEMLVHINQEFGITVILTEHRLEEVFPIADRVIVLEKGRLILDQTPKELIFSLWKNKKEDLYPYLPSISRLYIEHSNDFQQNDIPLTVKEGKQWINQLKIQTIENKDPIAEKQSHPLMELKNIDFQYDKHEKKVLDRLSLTVYENEFLAIVGANGTGKSTLLKVMACLEPIQRGTILFNGKKLKKPNPNEIGYLPQNPKLFFIHDTIEEELKSIIEKFQITNGEKKLKEWVEFFQLSHLLKRNPYDVSGGEMQKAAVACLLLTSPKLILFDEPTKGLDPEMKKQFGNLLQQLCKRGFTIVMVTHDIEFAASYASRCALMFEGEITVSSPTQQFFKGNTFYTTAINRLTRKTSVPEVISIEEARKTWQIR